MPLCRGGLIEVHHLPPSIRGDEETPLEGRQGITLKGMEAIHIAASVHRRGGNRNAAAAELGINPSTLYRKAKSLGIELPEVDGRSRPKP